MIPAQLGDLAERMVYKGARLAAVVQDEGGRWDVGNLIDHLDMTELRGLAVVMAGMIPLDQTVNQALGYIRWDETGQPVRPKIPACTVRELADRRLRAAS